MALSDQKRAQIIELREKGCSIREISRELNIARNTARMWINRYCKEGILEDKRKYNRGVRKYMYTVPISLRHEESQNVETEAGSGNSNSSFNGVNWDGSPPSATLLTQAEHVSILKAKTTQVPHLPSFQFGSKSDRRESNIAKPLKIEAEEIESDNRSPQPNFKTEKSKRLKRATELCTADEIGRSRSPKSSRLKSKFHMSKSKSQLSKRRSALSKSKPVYEGLRSKSRKKFHESEGKVSTKKNSLSKSKPVCEEGLCSCCLETAPGLRLWREGGEGAALEHFAGIKFPSATRCALLICALCRAHLRTALRFRRQARDAYRALFAGLRAEAMSKDEPTSDVVFSPPATDEEFVSDGIQQSDPLVGTDPVTSPDPLSQVNQSVAPVNGVGHTKNEEPHLSANILNKRPKR